MSMNMTWTIFFFLIPLKPAIYICLRGLRVYWYCPFSCEIENEAMASIFVYQF